MKSICLFVFLLFSVAVFAQNSENRSFEALDSLINLHYEQKEFDKVIHWSEKAAEKAAEEHGKQDTLYAQYIGFLGMRMAAIGKVKEGIIQMEIASEILKKEKGTLDEAYLRLVQRTAYYYNALGNFDKALALFSYHLEQNKMLGTQNMNYVYHLIQFGVFYFKAEKLEDAQVLMLEALRITKEINPQHPRYAQLLNNLGMIALKQGKLTEAEPFMTEALDIIQETKGKEDIEYGKMEGNLADVYSKLKQYKKADKHFEHTVAVHKKQLGENHLAYARVLGNYATLFFDQKMYKKAMPRYQEVLAIVERNYGSVHVEYANALNNITSIEHRRGNYELAKESSKKTLGIYQKVLPAKHPQIAKSSFNLAEVYTQLNQFDTALTYYNQAIQILCMDCDSTEITEIEQLVDKSYSSNSKILRALELMANMFQYKYTITRNEEDLKASYQALQVAIQINENVRNSFTGEQDKLRSLREMSNLVSTVIYTGLEFETSQDLYLANAFNYAEQNKSMLLLDAIKGERANVLGNLPDSLIQKERELQKRKEDLQRAQLKPVSTEEKKALTGELNELTLTIDAFLKEIKQTYPKYYALRYENILAKAKEIQDLLDDKSLLLEYFVSDTITYLFVLSNQTLEIYPIPFDKEKMGTEIKAFRKSLSNYHFIHQEPKKAYQLFTQKASLFYNKFLKEGLAGKAVENLIIITDGELGHLPFETFLTTLAPQSSQSFRTLNYLVRDYNISYSYSSTLWKENRMKPQEKKLATGEILGIASAYPAIDEDILRLRSPKSARLRQELKELPAAQEEVAALSKFFEGEFLYRPKVLGSEKEKEEVILTNEAYFKKNASRFKIIHLAMHGILNSSAPMMSALAFTENGDSLEDNFLYAYEISQMELNANLVVLSACETGLGKFEQGEGVISLARSFMYAGVPSLVVSLWQVNDYSTALIMQQFYRYLSEGMPKNEALRQAKLDYIQKTKGAAVHPAYWSPFIQLGDSRPIEIKTVGENKYLKPLIGFVIVLVLILIFMVQRKRGIEV